MSNVTQTILLAGLGFMGKMHAQVYKRLSGVSIVGVVDERVDRARESLKELGISAPVFASLEEALKQVKADILDVCVPTDRHTHLSLEGFRAGMAVFCEKPIALSVEQADLMIAESDKRGLAFQVGHCIRFWPEYQALKGLVESREKGTLLSLNLTRRAGRPAYSANDWLLDESRSMGALVDLHIHDTDFVHHLLGAPESVRSVGLRDKAGWSHVFTQYHFPDTLVLAEGGWDYPTGWGFEMTYQAIFEGGVLDYSSSLPTTLRWTSRAGNPEPFPFPQPEVDSGASAGGNISSLGGYYNELKYFTDCVKEGRKPQVATGEQALHSLKTIHAELKSLESGKSTECETSREVRA
jgi:predicted dehydrogenase